MQKAITDAESVVRFRSDIQERIRSRVRGVIEVVLEEELIEALGSERYARSGARQGYRNGKLSRRITTAQGTRALRIPRGRIAEADGSTREFRSEVLPRYARRSAEVDEAVLGCY